MNRVSVTLTARTSPGYGLDHCRMPLRYVASDAREGRSFMLEQIDTGRYQARCSCLRASPVLEGTRDEVEAALTELDWQLTASGAWRCPVCWGRARTQPPKAEGAKGGRKTILLVADDIDARDIYRTTLNHVGYRVIEAPTVKDARDAVRAFLPDVVVLDCQLPDGDGLELVNTWRDGKMGSVPVIVVSAHRERQDLDAAVLAGADLFVPKPCPGNVLAAHIDRVIRSGVPTRRVAHACVILRKTCFS